jgi:hypothetical protein
MKKVSHKYFFNKLLSNSLLENEEQQEWEEEDGYSISEKGVGTPSTLSCEAQMKASLHYEDNPQTEQRQWQKQEPIFWYDIPSSYPDWLLTVSLLHAIDCMISNMPVSIVLASQFTSHVHHNPNVNLHIEIEQQLSVGMNYMFKRKHNMKLIKNVWLDFKERL